MVQIKKYSVNPHTGIACAWGKLFFNYFENELLNILWNKDYYCHKKTRKRKRHTTALPFEGREYWRREYVHVWICGKKGFGVKITFKDYLFKFSNQNSQSMNQPSMNLWLLFHFFILISWHKFQVNVLTNKTHHKIFGKLTWKCDFVNSIGPLHRYFFIFWNINGLRTIFKGCACMYFLWSRNVV